MAKKRVIAHVMHEYEAAAATQRMSSPDVTEGYVLGMMEESDIEELRGTGILVEIVPDRPTTRAAAPARVVTSALRRSAIPPSGSAKGRIQPDDQKIFVVELTGPLFEHAREALERRGVEILEAVRPNVYEVRMHASQVDTLGDLPFVYDVTLDDGSVAGQVHTMAVDLPVLETGDPAPGKQMHTYDVLLQRAEDVGTVLAWVRARNIDIAGASGRKIRFHLIEGSPLVEQLASLDEVLIVEEYTPPRLFLEVARSLIGLAGTPVGATATAATNTAADLAAEARATPDGGYVSRPSASITVPDAVQAGTAHATARLITQTGDGEIIGVADTGLDLHADFTGRIAGVVALGRANDSSDPNGHGTHVAGIACGDGQLSAGQHAGVAPGARLFFQSLMSATGNLSGLPLDLGILFTQAYNAGVRIHNNSWGAGLGARYTINSIEVDTFVDAHRDMLLVFAAGNDGQAAVCNNARPGTVDWFSVGSPATAKNALVVGASRSSRTAGGFAAMRHRDAWPLAFPAPPIADEPVSGNPESVAGFSSRGPCDDRRIKPDLVAPGTDILAPRSSTAPLRNFWGTDPASPGYAYMGGTSMAAPMVAGCAALVREYFRKEHRHAPSAALLKATLINGTRPLSGSDAIEGHPHIPNFHQGFGAVDMRSTIPNTAAPGLRIAFQDAWEDPTRQLRVTGKKQRFQVTVEADLELRICLCWTDRPGRALQNNLDLLVEGPIKDKFRGNSNLFGALRPLDEENNVEIVRVRAPAPGTYMIQVTAFNLLSPQDFALVVSGALQSDLALYLG